MRPQDSRVLAPRFPDPATPSQCLLPSLLTYSEQCISLTLHFCQIKKKMDFRKQTIQRLLQQWEGDVAIGRTRAPDPKIYEHLSGQGVRRPIVWGGVNKAGRNRSWGSRWAGGVTSYTGDVIKEELFLVPGFPGGASGKEPACQCRKT